MIKTHTQREMSRNLYYIIWVQIQKHDSSLDAAILLLLLLLPFFPSFFHSFCSCSFGKEESEIDCLVCGTFDCCCWLPFSSVCILVGDKLRKRWRCLHAEKRRWETKTHYQKNQTIWLRNFIVRPLTFAYWACASADIFT